MKGKYRLMFILLGFLLLILFTFLCLVLTCLNINKISDFLSHQKFCLFIYALLHIFPVVFKFIWKSVKGRQCGYQA